MVEIKIIKEFNDVENNRRKVKPNKKYQCSKERAEYLIQKGFAKEIKSIKDSKEQYKW